MLNPLIQYGIYVEELTSGATKDYAIYTAGASLNYFGGRVGIGEASPDAPLHITSTAYSMLFLEHNSDTVDAPASILYLRSKGSNASPTILADNDAIGRLRFRGWDGASNYRDAAYITAYADTGTQSTSSMPGRLEFDTSPNGTFAPTTRMIIASNGDVTIQNKDNHTQLFLSTYSDTSSERSILYLRKSHNDTLGTVTTTVDGEELGGFYIQGVDSGGAIDNGFRMRAVQNGSAGTRIPTDVFFGTYSSSAENAYQFVLYNTGDVGIGIAAPDRALHVAGSAPVLILESTESSNADLARGSEISWVGTDGARGSMAAIRGAHAGSGTDHKGMLRFYTQAGDGTGHLSGSSGTERMRIKANGIIDINSAGGAIDHGFVFYGNAKQFHVGQYDAQDELILGTGTTLGATGTKSLTIHAATSGYAVSLRATKTGLVDTGANTSISGSLTAAVNASISILRVHGTMIEAGSGTHPLLAGTHFVAPTITGAGAATTTGATVYISGAPGTATNPYALYVNSGNIFFGYGQCWYWWRHYFF